MSLSHLSLWSFLPNTTLFYACNICMYAQFHNLKGWGNVWNSTVCFNQKTDTKGNKKKLNKHLVEWFPMLININHKVIPSKPSNQVCLHLAATFDSIYTRRRLKQMAIPLAEKHGLLFKIPQYIFFESMVLGTPITLINIC